MKYDPDLYHRRSIRLKGYDYTQPGAYFITICTANRECLFGEVVDGKMRLNEIGKIVWDEWLKTAELRPRVVLDAFVVMPNHLHGIIVLVDGRGTLQRAPTSIQRTPTSTQHAPTSPQHTLTVERFGKPTSDSIPTIVRLFKSATTTRINILRGTPGMPVWQRNYYEHIIRNEESLRRIRQYIADNPERWVQDRDNPDAFNPEEDYLWLP
ncbi:MAG: REP-associated tyrosine transposase [Desulfomicrobiaceae bacterium]|nr:REP-associated tyrosine transposase [Desulfomicrobiaceae bacterium]